MRRLLLILGVLSLAACTRQTDGNADAFDAMEIFQLGSNTVEVLPVPQNDEAVVRYGGWSLNELIQAVGNKNDVQFVQEDSPHEPWANEKLAPGIYHIKKGQPVPAVILASALLAYQIQNGELPFESAETNTLATMTDDTHCKEGPSETYVGLYWSEGFFIDTSYCSVLGGGVWEATR